MNKVILIGRLTADPELTHTQNDKMYCSFTLAVSRPKYNGQDQGADFVRCKAWGSTAKSLTDYMAKGSQIAVDGKISVHSYEDQGTKKYITEVVAASIHFLTNKAQQQQLAGNGYTGQNQAQYEQSQQYQYQQQQNPYAGQYGTQNQHSNPYQQPPQQDWDDGITEDDIPF